MIQNKISDFYEIGPGKVLSGLNRRINNQIHTNNVRTRKQDNNYINI